MIVVSDTSPLNYLVLVDSVQVLPELFGNVYVPPEVIDELCHPRTPEMVRRWAESVPAWLHVRRAEATADSLVHLGAGEVFAIALAKELGARWLLMDERDGRRFAARQGLHVIGTLAVLDQAASRGLLDLGDVLERLRQTSFRISLPLLRAVLERDAARRSRKSRG